MPASPARFWVMVFVLLGAAATVQFVTVRNESQIYDESNQLLTGCTYLKTGHYTIGFEQPPLLKLLWAIPVAMMRPDPPPSGSRLVEDQWRAGQDFLYHNRLPADSMLMAGRSCAIAISVLLGVAIAFWARRHFGARVALLAVFLFACDPNFLANGRYIKNDVGAALLIFAAAMTWGAYLMRPSRKLLLFSGLALGLALATKFSALILVPVMLILYVIRRWQERRGFGIGECARSFGAAGLVACFVIFAAYGFDVTPLNESPTFHRLIPGFPANRVPVPALGYFRGLLDIGVKQTEGGLSSAYLLGEHSQFGWWYMSPVAFAAKTPLAELALLAIAAGLALQRLRRVRLRDVEFHWFLLVIPPAAYFAVSLPIHFHAGMRHLLPLDPFLFVFAAAVLLGGPVPEWRWTAVAAGAALLILESAAIYPHYLAFFNALAGGPTGGRRLLVDSNLDWGQDVKNLKTYLDARRIPEVCISYFGMADLDYYGIRHTGLPAVPDAGAARNLDCVAAISVTNLAMERSRYAGLDALRPDARIGYSIYVYDLRKRRPAGGGRGPSM